MSRDHFTRPVQSDRTGQNYGHTRLGAPDDGWARNERRVALICVAMVIVLLAGFWLAHGSLRP